MKRTIVIGGGFAGLSAACFLAQNGQAVTLVEKNKQIGGRCHSFEAEGFVFDMGPSWYWMPDVFERFYQQFGHTTSDFYELIRLDPSYQVIFSDGDKMVLPASYEDMRSLFEKYEKGSAQKLDKFLEDGAYKYEVGMKEFVHKPSLSIGEFADWRIAKDFLRLDLLKSISREINSKFKHTKLRQLLEFPVLFLGAKPQDTPALYSLMNYADIKLGTWYPMGGMVEIPRAMMRIAEELGVDIKLDHGVTDLKINNSRIVEVVTTQESFSVDSVISTADYHHTETKLLPPKYRSYSDKYWSTRQMAPSSLLFYVGLDKKIEGLLHHNLFFDTDFERHADQIYTTLEWPDQPLFYVCCPSKTDPSVAPEGKENLFFLIPLAAGIEDNMTKRETLFDILVARLHERIGVDIKKHIVYKRSFCVEDFKTVYNSFKGNAYGLANTLMQTAFLKPKLASKKVKNLLFAGQLTTPGPGVPPSLISGEVAAKYLLDQLNMDE